jgi:adenosylmethionine-8-amino-7-oxononanoate aminotransferase
MDRFAQLDHRYVWHPFTQMRDWLRRESIVIVSGKGATLRDVQGREYLDANSSIWTNLHGHNHPRINTAIQNQLKKIAHSSALGLANEPASLLAERLVAAANDSVSGSSLAENAGARADNRQSTIHNRQSTIVNPQSPIQTPSTIGNRQSAIDDQSAIGDQQSTAIRRSAIGDRRLQKVFFSDDGSTALEVALKLAYEFTLRTRSKRAQPRFASLQGAYHGDTIGAVSLGHIDLFHKAYSNLLFKTDSIPAPYCYRCPFNRAAPERRDAREYVQCKRECVGQAEKIFGRQKKRGNPYAAFVFEPLMQGAAGMIAQPNGWLSEVTAIARSHGGLLIADEVMTGFGRTGFPSSNSKLKAQNSKLPLFACQHEGVQPDFLCLAKGLTGGYLPMAATLTTQPVFDAFLGEYDEFKTFFHGHSYTGNQLGAAAALASLNLLETSASMQARTRLQSALRGELQKLWALPNVGDIRQVGLTAGIELVRNWRTREPFDLRERAGIRVCEAMAKRGVLTRPIGNVIVLMPPYCTTPAQVRKMVQALYDACKETLEKGKQG